LVLRFIPTLPPSGTPYHGSCWDFDLPRFVRSLALQWAPRPPVSTSPWFYCSARFGTARACLVYSIAAQPPPASVVLACYRALRGLLSSPEPHRPRQYRPLAIRLCIASCTLPPILPLASSRPYHHYCRTGLRLVGCAADSTLPPRAYTRPSTLRRADPITHVGSPPTSVCLTPPYP